MTWIVQFVLGDEEPDDDGVLYDDDLLVYGWIGREGAAWCRNPLDAERFASRADAERFMTSYGAYGQVAEVVEVAFPMVTAS
jgi:hypothetical protein